jgi:hypothetical protein
MTGRLIDHASIMQVIPLSVSLAYRGSTTNRDRA